MKKLWISFRLWWLRYCPKHSWDIVIQGACIPCLDEKQKKRLEKAKTLTAKLQ